MTPCWRLVPGGAEVRVRAQPNASKDAIEGQGEDASGQTFLKVRVRAVPEKGKANAAVEKLLAKALRGPGGVVERRDGRAEGLDGALVDLFVVRGLAVGGGHGDVERHDVPFKAERVQALVGVVDLALDPFEGAGDLAEVGLGAAIDGADAGDGCAGRGFG